MMRWIAGSSLKFRRLVVAIGAGVLVLGVSRLGDTPVDVLPEFMPPTVEVQTEALGLSAAEVEQFITVPLEQDLLNGVAFLERIESASLPGLSSVVMTFEPGTDLLDARQVVQERLTQAVGAAGLPEVAKPPQMLQPLSSTSRVLMIRLSSGDLSPIEQSVLARWVIVPRLLGVEGVANVAIWGQRERQLQVLVDPERLRERGVSLADVISSSGNALEVSPLSFLEASTPGTGGFIDTLNQRLQIFHEQAITTADQLAQVTLEGQDGSAVFANGNPLTLGDVSRVVEDHQPLIGDAICGDGECLLLVVEKFPEANTIEVTGGIEAAIDELGPGLGDVELDSSVYRPATYLETSLRNLGWALLIGGVLSLLVLGAFFWHWRTAVLSAVAIAVSLAAAGLVLHLRGAAINLMVLAGLVMALGALVDDAVVDVDNLVRRIGRRRKGDGAPARPVIVEASLEMRSAMLFATLIVVAALLPVFFMEREAGAFLPPIAISYLLAVSASMAVALAVTPALGMMLLANAPPDRRESPVTRWVRRGYDRVSSRIVPRPVPALVAVVVVTVAGLASLPFLNTSLRPSLEERDVLVHLEAPPGTSLPSMNEVTTQALDGVRSLPGVGGAGAHIGRAVQSDQIVNVNSAELWVNLDPGADYHTTLDAIDDVIDGLPQVTSDLTTYSEQRVTEILEGTDDDVVVRLYGENAETLRTQADQVRGVISGIDGVEGTEVEVEAEEPTVEVEVDLDRARRFGVKPGDVRRAAATLLSGVTVGFLFEQQKVFDVVVWGEPEIRRTEGDVRNLLIDTPDGGHVRLGDVAEVRIESNPTVIRHESVSRFIDVSADVEGRDVGAVAGDIDRALQQVAFPLEHHAELLGGYAEQQAARTRGMAVAVAAAIGIFLLLQAALGSWRLAVLAFVTLPIALVGGVLGAIFAGGMISLGSVAGFVAVLGIAVRGSVASIRHYQDLERREGRAFGPDLVVMGTRDRLAPLLMTLSATGAALLPILFTGGAGLEIVRPMAVVVLGGLLTTTVINLVVLPAAYLRYGFVAEPDTSSEDLVVSVPEAAPVRG